MTPPQFSEAVGNEVRAELARQRKTQAELAAALGITPLTASRRLAGTAPFDTEELHRVAGWLGVPVEQFIPRGPVEVGA